MPLSSTSAAAPAASGTAQLFHGLSEPSRLAILQALRGGERSVNELVAETGLTQSNVSNHLACLHGCGLVRRESVGRHNYYSFSDPRVETLLLLAESLLAGAASGVLTCPRCAARERARADAAPTD